MPRGTYLSEKEKERISAFRIAEWSVKRIAHELNRSRTVITNYIKDPDNYGHKTRKKTYRKLTKYDVRHLKREASKGKMSCKQLRDAHQLSVTVQRVHQILQEDTELVFKKRKGSPVLKEHHKMKRLEFAEKYVDFGLNWRNVIFSDEKKFNLDGPDGWQGYWHCLRHEEQIFSRRQNGGGSIMIWGAFSYEGKSKIVPLQGKQNAGKYIETLRHNMLEFNEQKHGMSAIFQHDNASIHSANLTTSWLEEQEINIMSWPALSPDLNPIENLWSVLARMVYQGGKQYSSVKELEHAIVQCWNNIPMTMCQNLITSMKNRCVLVLKAKGNKIKY